MFRWADADYETRIARLERTVIVLTVLLALVVGSLCVMTWNDITQTSTDKALAETQWSLVTIAADQRKIDKSQNDTIGHLISTDKSQDDNIGLLKTR